MLSEIAVYTGLTTEREEKEMTNSQSIERNQNELNKLALEFVHGFSQLEISNDNKTEKEDILDVLYTKLNKLGNLLGFKEPTYWADAYDEFEENKPNYESCVAEINFYLFNITIGRDKKTEGDITRIYKSTHDMYYQSMMFLFVAVSDYFHGISVLREKNEAENV